MSTGFRSRALLLAAALLFAGLAGCVGSVSEDQLTFEQAREQAHTTIGPEEDSPLQMGVIEPEATDVAQGEQNVTFVLWDGEGEPVEDAEFTIDAFMPMMGHGTAPETDPVHDREGVYRGATNFMMGGPWVLYLNASLATGQQAHFVVDVDVAGGSMDGEMGMDHGQTAETEYTSYEDARDAEGETFAPQQNASTRLKLLEPADRGDVSQGEQNVTVLLYDEDTDEPVTNGTAFLNATMPAMGHGTSPETDPTHAAHGVWKGMTTLPMNGTWVLDIELRDGERTLGWSINLTVGDASMEETGDDEPAFEPYEVEFADDVSGPSYEETHAFDVESANATLTINATLDDATPITDEVTVELLDPEGEQLGSLTLTADTNETSLAVGDVPDAGEYQVHVTGQALDASYLVVLHVAPA